MRKIDKSVVLSSHYKTWEVGIEREGKNHKKYDSSNNKFYRDIVMNLFYCQSGVCAYTESLLCNEKFYAESNWNAGSYPVNDEVKFFGELDHFNPELKADKAWLWSNLFMIHSDVNSVKVKGRKSVDSIMKPDEPGYDEFKLLFYFEKEHIFIPHPDLQSKDQDRVTYMLDTLGINHPTIIANRKGIIQPILEQTKLTDKPYEEFVVNQFFTAFEMCKRKAN
jgi:hypothetical protein